MPRLPAALSLVLALAAVLGSARAAAAMRCGNRLVQRGDSRYQVRQLCGEPQDVVRSQALRQVTLQVVPGVFDTVAQAVPVEQWTYDFGPNRFQRHLTFENGTLVRIATGRKGFRAAAARAFKASGLPVRKTLPAPAGILRVAWRRAGSILRP